MGIFRLSINYMFWKWSLIIIDESRNTIFQFYEFVLFLVSFVMHTAKVLMPLSDFKANECFRLDENTIKTITLLNLQLSINVCKQQFFTLLICNNNNKNGRLLFNAWKKIRIKNIVFSGNITENKPIIFLLYLVNLYMQNYESLISA
jgi:hypothetical protein